MRHFWLLLLASMTTAVLAASADIAPERQKELHNLLVQDCGSCHGLTMKGGLGKPLLPAALEPFPDDAIAEVILDGVQGTPMPPWRGLLTDTEALWIARQLKKGLPQ